MRLQGSFGMLELCEFEAVKVHDLVPSYDEVLFTAEIWDTKGLAVPTLGYGDAASQLKFGSCEDDEPSQGFESRCRAVPCSGVSMSAASVARSTPCCR